MTLYALNGVAPTLPEGEPWYVAPGARVIGDVRIGGQVSIWFNAVLRGDNEPITLGWGSNVQDNCVLHTDPGFPVVLGRSVTLGHGAIVHGCTVGEGSLIGMGATVLNGARIGRGCVIGAGALVTEGKEIPDYALVMGTPGKVVRIMEPEASEALRRGAANYRDKLGVYAAGLTEL